MASISLDKIRNFALVGHNDAGKTAFAEDLLFRMGALTRRGRVEDGNTACDFDEEEIRRGFSVNAALVAADYQGYHLNILDVPGSADFIADLITGMRVVDFAVVVVNGVSGVEVGTERAWREAQANGVPLAVVINKLDRERSDFDNAFQQLQDAFPGVNFVIMTYPVGSETSFRGYVDVNRNVATTWPKGFDGDPVEGEVPADLAEKVKSLAAKLVDAAAEQDDALMEKYFEAGTLSPEEVASALTQGITSGKIVPVFCAAGYHGVGSGALLDAVVRYFPSPAAFHPRRGQTPGGEEEERPADPAAPFSAFVFKTVNDPFAGKLSYVRVFSGKLTTDDALYDATADAKFKCSTLLAVNGKKQTPVSELNPGEFGALAKVDVLQTGHTLTAPDKPLKYPELALPEPVMWYAISPRSKGDEDKLIASLTKLLEEDPTVRMERNLETKELVVAGMGEQHLQVVFSKLEKRFGVGIDYKIPRVAYRETIRKGAKAQGRYKKQTGGRGQFGDVWLEIQPRPRGEGFEFQNNIFGGAIPTKYVPSVEKGVVETLAKGVVAGYPVVDIMVSVYDGSYHTVDSSDLAFKIAASMALKNAFAQANPAILEPIADVTVRVPSEYMGAITSDLSGKRGRVMGMEPAGLFQEIRAYVPMSETFRLSSDIRSLTGGKGTFTVRFSHYEEAPPDVAKRVIAEADKHEEEEG